MLLLADLFMGLYSFLIGALCLYGLHRYWILYLYYRYYKRAPALQQPAWEAASLPAVTVQLPVFNERYVIERLIDAACQIEYPASLLQIQVLDDSTDDTTCIAKEKVAQKQREGYTITHLHRTDRTGFKAGALEAGLRGATGELIAIFDADFLPPSDFLKKTVLYFQNAHIGMVQTRWGHLNDNHSLLTWIQSLFLDGHFLIEHTARNRSGAFFNFNGTAGIWRREAIESAGGWEHDTLTEDLDLSYRAQMKGWKFLFLPDVVCPAELPVDINAFKTQQNRWTMGAIQTARKVLPTIWRSDCPFKVKMEATFHLTGCIGYLLMAILSVMMPFSLYFRHMTDWPLTGFFEGFTLVSTSLSVTLFYGVCIKELYPKWTLRLHHIPLMISVGIGMCISNARAVVRGFRKRSYEFKRTPKYSVVNRDKSWTQKSYRGGNPMAALVEAAFAAYFFVALDIAFDHRAWASVPFIALFSFGYAYVAFKTTLHSLRLFPNLPE